MVGAAGAAGAAAAAELQTTHQGHRWRTGADGVTGYTVAALVEDWRRRAAAPVEDREPADINGPAAERPALRLGEPESVHHWTGTTCLAAPLACSDSSEERDVGRSRLDRVEGGGDNGKPGRASRHPRLAVTRVLIRANGRWL
jgi:hypothetical protein